jgi:maltose alpha-D-glucosyltransferase/alpha-amylase
MQSDELERALRRELPAALPRWLEPRRWYSDKGRTIDRVALDAVTVARAERDWLALIVPRIAFADGGEARYFVPLALSEASSVIDPVSAVSIAERSVVDAAATPWFGPWLLDSLANAPAGSTAPWRFAIAPESKGIVSAARQAPPTLGQAEQSNTSLRFDDLLVVKLFRRLQPAPNPDQEMLRALATAGFDRAPRYVGAASWRAPDGRDYPVALALAYVPNGGDGWTWFLGRLHAVAIAEPGATEESSAAAQLLGERTGELHVALSQITEPDFVPVTQDAAGVVANQHRTILALEAAIDLLRENVERLPARLRPVLPEVAAGLRALRGRSDGYGAELGLPRIRVHGDYHLGQTLRTRDDDWVIIDFEGEPARPVAERRQRWSPLKDVAGMLRSFAYARGAAQRSPEFTADASGRDRLATWEQGVRQAFLDGYRTAAAAAPAPLVPRDDLAFARALAAWELDKALYEIAYEARNRPDWLELPLRTLVPELGDQAEAETGGAPA